MGETVNKFKEPGSCSQTFRVPALRPKFNFQGKGAYGKNSCRFAERTNGVQTNQYEKVRAVSSSKVNIDLVLRWQNTRMKGAPFAT